MDISRITDYLYIAAHPRHGDAETIQQLGISFILNMIWYPPAAILQQPPFRMLILRSIDSPLFPIPIRRLRRGVEAALPVIREGGKVLVYCRKGRHRSVAMAACILIAMGFTADEAMERIKAQRPIADPYIFYIRSRIYRFEAEWRKSPALPGEEHG
jgi:protein tyrosine phosphatase (PTP) superfamily phosphohydrolase (DUF442 family)